MKIIYRPLLISLLLAGVLDVVAGDLKTETSRVQATLPNNQGTVMGQCRIVDASGNRSGSNNKVAVTAFTGIPYAQPPIGDLRGNRRDRLVRFPKILIPRWLTALPVPTNRRRPSERRRKPGNQAAITRRRAPPPGNPRTACI